MNDAIFSCQRETIALQIRGGDRERQKEAEGEGDKSAGIKGLMEGGGGGGGKVGGRRRFTLSVD